MAPTTAMTITAAAATLRTANASASPGNQAASHCGIGLEPMT